MNSITDGRAKKGSRKLAVLISGGGTTLVNLHQRISHGQLDAEVAVVIASRSCRGVTRAEEIGLRVKTVPRRQFDTVDAYSDAIFTLCREHDVSLVVLGGFLSQLRIPDDFQYRVLNIHPSLIPSFSGKGMYGHHVHEAVLNRGCRVSGCTVHFCDNEYDHGPIITQQTVPVLDHDTPDLLAERVFAEECEVYPRAISQILDGRFRIEGRRVFTKEVDES